MLLASAVKGETPGPGAEDHPRHVVLISVDGLMPESYTRADELGYRVPNLRRLQAEGAWARGVVGVLPTLTYPSHTTLVTGVPPRLHGITSNRVFDPLGTSNEAWHWYAEEVQALTLVGAARAERLTTASVFWPVSVGMDSDFNLPEVWRSGSKHTVDLRLLRQLTTPHLLEAVASERGRPFVFPLSDDDRVDVAVHLIRTYRPHLLLLHIFELDFAQHDYGPRSPEATAELEASDARVGRVLQALEEAGIRDETLVAVVSDHGFLPVREVLKPNSVLRQAGLVSVDEKGKVTSWRAFAHPDAGTAAVILADPGDEALVQRVRSLFETRLADPQDGLHRILDRKQIEEMGGGEEASLVLDARAGFYFSDAAVGEWKGPSEKRGTHGFAPDRHELNASLLLSGPGLAGRGDLGEIPMTAVAPTLARFLGLQLSAQAAPPLALW